MDISLVHTQHSNAIAQPIPTPVPMLMRRGAPNSVQWWLVCQTTSVCNNHNMCTAQILSRAFWAFVCSDVIQTAILNWGSFGRWNPGHVRLPAESALFAFSNTLCEKESWGSTWYCDSLCCKAAQTVWKDRWVVDTLSQISDLISVHSHRVYQIMQNHVNMNFRAIVTL